MMVILAGDAGGADVLHRREGGEPRRAVTRMGERGVTGVTPTAHAQEMAIVVGDHIDHLDRFFLDEFTDDLIADLAIGRLDLAVSTVRPREPGITIWPLADEEFWLVGAPKMAAQAQDVDAYQRLPVVTFSLTLPLVRRYWASVFGYQPNLRVAAVLPNLFAVKSAVVHGLGISVLPSYLISDEVSSGALVRLLDPEVPPINTLFLAGRTAELNRRSRLRAAAAMIVEAVKQHQGVITP